jgi:hypothetical protein
MAFAHHALEDGEEETDVVEVEAGGGLIEDEEPT